MIPHNDVSRDANYRACKKQWAVYDSSGKCIGFSYTDTENEEVSISEEQTLRYGDGITAEVMDITRKFVGHMQDKQKFLDWSRAIGGRLYDGHRVFVTLLLP
jgi:hypothetical protein